MNFILLDLDCSYFTRAADLDGLYGGLWGTLPLHFGVVPFHIGAGEYVPPGADPRRRYPLADNRELVEYLRGRLLRGEARILLHGYDHDPRGRRGEFSTAHEARGRLIRGRAALEDLFGVRARVFLPPNGGLCRDAMSALRGLGMHVIGRYSFDPRRRERDYFPETLWNWARRQVFLRRHRDLPFPWILRSHGMGELDPLWLMPGNEESRLAGLAEGIRRTGGTLLLATHYWELARHPDLRQALQGLIRRIASFGNTRFPAIEDALFRPFSQAR